MSETAVASKTEIVQEALLNYLQSVKTFYAELYSPSNITKMEALLPTEQIGQSDEPIFIRLARAEKWWLSNLFLSLSKIDQILTNIERWRMWFLDLVDNLEFTEENIQLLTKGPDAVYDYLSSRKLDEGYVRLVVNNATNDFLEYIHGTREILDELVSLDEFIQRLESPVLQIVELRLQRIKEVNYKKLLQQMQQLLAATYNAPDQENFLRNLAALIHIFAGWRQMIQLDDSTLDKPEAISQFVKEARKTVNKLNQLTRNFQIFVESRNQADYYLRQAELSTIRMMLSYEGTAEKWWLEYIQADPEKIKGFIPEKLDSHQLLIGVTHSLALLEDLEQRLFPQMPSLKTTVGELGKFLQSNAIELYQEINQSRLALWEKYEKLLVSNLMKLRKALHDLIKYQDLNRDRS
ncbi:MAG: hypothetical protein ACFFCH_05850 [Promethearchaeota archaeon]